MEDFLLGIDFETYRIQKGAVAPKDVCYTVYGVDGGKEEINELYAIKDPAYYETLKGLLEDDSIVFILHNAKYDLSVLHTHYPELRPLIWKKIMNGRVKDTLMREKLINITRGGSIDFETVQGKTVKAIYSLAALEEKYLGIDRSADKEGENSVRINYCHVADIPSDTWPDNFRDYALADPVGCYKVYLTQEKARAKIIKEIGIDPFKTEDFRVQLDFSLALVTEHGVAIDKEQVLKITEEYDAAYNDPSLTIPMYFSGYLLDFLEENDYLCLNKNILKEFLNELSSLDEKQLEEATRGGCLKQAIPPMPDARGILDHQEDCVGHKGHPEYKKGKKVRNCGCPPKMKKAVKESLKTKPLLQYVWRLARLGILDAWASDALVKKLKELKLHKTLLTGERTLVLDVPFNEKGTTLGDLENLPRLEDIADDESLKKLSLKKSDTFTLSLDKDWTKEFGHAELFISIVSTRKKYEKMITSYIPGMYWKEGEENCPAILPGETDRLAGKEPTDVLHFPFQVFKATGRTSSRASKKKVKGKGDVYMFPSANGQQADPKIRSCVIPRKGKVLFSIDYSGMELGTLAQICINLFGFSILGDVINAGRDSHSYLGMFIAQMFDPWFRKETEGMDSDELYDFFVGMKKSKEPNVSPEFHAIFNEIDEDDDETEIVEEDATKGDFYAHYRKFAKPTGLGFPGGLGARTFITYAKTIYGVEVDLPTAKKLKSIWLSTYPEMGSYLDYISKRCKDKAHGYEIERDDDTGKSRKKQWLAYTTPRGMYRPKCNFCACANGMGLQSPSSDGANSAVIHVLHDIFTEGNILYGEDRPVMVSDFIHDELFGEVVDDDKLTERMDYIVDVMVREMEKITPDVKASAEVAIMNRWSKKAFPYKVEGRYRPYEEKE